MNSDTWHWNNYLEVAAKEALISEGEATQRIVGMGVHSRVVQHQVRPEVSQKLWQDFCYLPVIGNEWDQMLRYGGECKPLI